MKLEEVLEGEWSFGRLIKRGLGIIVLIMVLGIAGSILGVFSSAVTAPSRVISKTLETDNIIQSYEWFYDVDASYKARLAQVIQYKTFINEADKNERFRVRTELAAMQQTCRDLATKYNANSEKMNKSIFKGWSLPHNLSQESCN